MPTQPPRLVLTQSLARAWPLEAELDLLETPYEVAEDFDPPLQHCAHWKQPSHDCVIAVWTAAAVITGLRQGTLTVLATAAQTQARERWSDGVRVMLLVVGSAPGLERTTGMLTLQTGMSVRRVSADTVDRKFPGIPRKGDG